MSWITKERGLAIYLRDGFACACCGLDLKNAAPADITLDHLSPRWLGGGHESTNLVTSCRDCNCVRKHMKDWKEYALSRPREMGGAIKRIEYLRNLPLNRELAKALIEGTAGDEELEALR